MQGTGNGRGGYTNDSKLMAIGIKTVRIRKIYNDEHLSFFEQHHVSSTSMLVCNIKNVKDEIREFNWFVESVTEVGGRLHS